MSNNNSPVDRLLDLTTAYVKTTIRLVRYKTTEKTAEVVSSIAYVVVVVVVVLLLFLNLNLGAALYLGEVTGKLWMGFLLVAAFYLLLLGVVYLFRNRLIRRPVEDALVRKMMEGEAWDEKGSSSDIDPAQPQ